MLRRHVSLGELEIILRERNFVHLDINNTQKRFEKIFSKMEVMMAYEVVEQLIDMGRVKSISINTPESIYRGNDSSFSNYLSDRLEILGDRNVSDMEKKFIEDHAAMKAQRHSNGLQYETNSVSLWRDNRMEKLLRGSKSPYCMITGFDTDTEILVNALETVDRSMIPIIVSDCVSAPSERKHFAALEILSRFAYILDSRDIISVMGW